MAANERACEMLKRLHCDIHGKVQHCGFRYFCWKCAKKAGVTGWAANDTDHDTHVVLEVQGNESQLDQFFKLLELGNGHCRIDSNDKSDVDVDVSENGFQARYKLH